MTNQRERDAEKVLNNILRNSENELERAYARALRDVNNELAGLYGKMGDDVSLAQANRYGRLASLQDKLRNTINDMNRDARSITLGSLRDTYAESFLREAHNIEFQAQQKLGFTSKSLESEEIEEAVNYTSAVAAGLGIAAAVRSRQQSSSTMSIRDRFKRNRVRLIDRLEDEITQGIVRNEGYRVVARRVSQRMDMDYNRALTMVRTESRRVRTITKNRAWEQAKERGVTTVKVWNAALDERTRESHQELDGQEADENGLFHYDGLKAEGPGMWGEANMDINCRCDYTQRVPGYEDNIRRARREDGTYLTTASNYDEWLKEKG